MNSPSKSLKLALTGIISAIAASLCCITPVLALVSGAGGIASSFSWLESARPYLNCFTLLVLGFAWYKKLKPKYSNKARCACDKEEKTSFIQSKKFLGIVTAFAFLMMVFPYYGHFFYPEAEKEVVVVLSGKVQEAKFNVSGMTCISCEEHIKHAVYKLPGIIDISASSTKGTVCVKFDQAKTNIAEIEKTIITAGYSVIHKK